MPSVERTTSYSHPGIPGGGIRRSRPAGNQHQRRGVTTYDCVKYECLAAYHYAQDIHDRDKSLGVSNPREPIGGRRPRDTDGPERAPLFPTVAGNRAEEGGSAPVGSRICEGPQ